MVYIRTGIEELADADIISAQSGHYQVFHIAIVWCQGASRMAWAVAICRSRPRYSEPPLTRAADSAPRALNIGASISELSPCLAHELAVGCRIRLERQAQAMVATLAGFVSMAVHFCPTITPP